MHPRARARRARTRSDGLIFPDRYFRTEDGSHEISAASEATDTPCSSISRRRFDAMLISSPPLFCHRPGNSGEGLCAVFCVFSALRGTVLAPIFSSCSCRAVWADRLDNVCRC